LPSIHLLPLGDVAPRLVDRLCPPLEARFAASVAIDAAAPIRPEWLDAERGQYAAAAILDWLLRSPPPDGGWRLALLPGDLFAAGLESALGVSTLGGCCGVLALAPLHAAPGGDDSGSVFFRRVLTEAVHEIGHMAGLGHCDDSACVMHFSRTVEETDRKGADFCPACRAGR